MGCLGALVFSSSPAFLLDAVGFWEKDHMMQQDDAGVTDSINRLVKLKQVANKPVLCLELPVTLAFSFLPQAFC